MKSGCYYGIGKNLCLLLVLQFALLMHVGHCWKPQSSSSRTDSNSLLKHPSQHTHRSHSLPTFATALEAPNTEECVSSSVSLISSSPSSWTRIERGGGEKSNAVVSSIANMTDWVGTTPRRCWGILFFAIFVEIYATTLMKIGMDSRSVSKTAISSSLYLVSLLCFGLSLRQIDVSVAYAIWSALGTLFVSIAGMTLFGEARSMTKGLSIGLILIGVIGLNMQGDGGH
jgi:small multidrug resistance pump